jgi:hypothetical protein
VLDAVAHEDRVDGKVWNFGDDQLVVAARGTQHGTPERKNSMRLV